MSSGLRRVAWSAPRRYPRAAAAVLLCAALLVAATGCQASAPAGPLASPEYKPETTPDGVVSHRVPLAGMVEPPEEGAYVGVFRPPAPFLMDRLDAYTEVSDKHPAILMWFQPWAENGSSQFDTAAVVATLRRGSIPLITWEPWDPGADPHLVPDPSKQPEFQLSRIVDGEFDGYMRDWARAIANVGGPVMLRPMHEMNGDWYPWGGTVNGNKPEEFVLAWHRMHDIFEQEGATNVTWVWSINRTSHPDIAENRPPAYYPGDDYVDWTSISGFNWGDTRRWQRWLTFRQLYAEPLGYLRSVGKPIVISEFGSVETPGDKAEWVEDAYRRMEDQDLIGAVVYYDKGESGLKGEQDWNIDSSPESFEAYQAAVARDHYVGAPAKTLSEWAERMTAADWMYLQAYRGIYDQ